MQSLQKLIPDLPVGSKGGESPLFSYRGVILFLDFDGVLHPHNERQRPWHNQEGVFSRLDFIQRALKDTQTPIVILSSWRLSFPEDELKDMLGDLSTHYAGKTPDLSGDFPSVGLRQREIEHWLYENAKNAQWISLDDDLSGYEDECDQLIWCNPETGVSCEEETMLRREVLRHIE